MESEKKVSQAVLIQRALEKQQQKIQLKWHVSAASIIKDQLKARKKLQFTNDWKVKFYESKLNSKIPFISKLRKLIE